MSLKQTRLAPKDYPRRAEVGNAYDWTDPEYRPVEYTCQSLLGITKPAWADEVHVGFLEMLQRPSVSRSGELVNMAASGVYDFRRGGRFLNPGGKTGIVGRGGLGKWGCNWAADVIVTKEEDGELFVLLCKKVTSDGDPLCFPAGMVEAGEEVPATMRRELCEEAVIESSAVDRLFNECKVATVYRGFVDDYRNTDHAWMVTQATHFHASPEVASALHLGVKDKIEIQGSAWYKATEVEEMYASHKDWLNKVIAWHEARAHRAGEKRPRDD